MEADKPVNEDGRQYHLQTSPGDLAAHCLLVGSPERAEMIARTMFRLSRKVGDHRGLKSFTGIFAEMPVSVVTTGMGSASTAIVLPEAVRSGARRFIRVGSCGTLWKEPKLGESVICTGAVRLDGASENWAPIQYPAVADYRVVAALVATAEELNLPHYVGIGATTTCFNEGQARPGQVRPDDRGYVPPRLQALHEEFVARGVLFYSMEEATLFVWCATHGGYWAGAVDAIYAQRQTNEFAAVGDEDAARIALLALLLLSRKYPLSVKEK
ncbi:nucleoside phosphorylase [Candidatus Uhrbacteria bacterium]|nr:nucleoside phosphorylase [Candidatus Uhrbacteria bacterium]